MPWEERLRQLILVATLAAQQAANLFEDSSSDDSSSESSDESYEYIDDENQLDTDWNSDDEGEFIRMMQGIQTPEIPGIPVYTIMTPDPEEKSPTESDD